MLTARPGWTGRPVRRWPTGRDDGAPGGKGAARNPWGDDLHPADQLGLVPRALPPRGRPLPRPAEARPGASSKRGRSGQAPSPGAPATLASAARGLLAAGLAAAYLGGAATAARAQGKLDARYTATLAGVPIGKGAMVVDIADDQYTAAVSGMTTGLARAFAGGQGSAASRGRVRNGALFPASFASTMTADKRTEELRIVLSGGTVKEYAIDPPNQPSPERIPLTDAHRRGVLDPMSAFLLRASGNGDPVSPEICRRTIPVFDGRMRYDLKLAFKRTQAVRAAKGYEGPAIVCAIFFAPIAGYIPDRPAITYLARQQDMEVWLTPIAGTRVMVPFRLSLPTPLGLGVLEASQFVTAPAAARALPTSARAP